MILKVGCKAYIDSFNGMIPCRVLSIKSSLGRTGQQLPSSDQKVEVEVTRDVGRHSLVYRKGEVLTKSALWVLPRKAYYKSANGGRVKPYAVEITA